MKKRIFTFLTFFASLVLQAQQIKVEPASWWSGLQEPELQLMISGKDIASYKVSVTAKDVYLKEAVTLENPNYQILYLDISDSAPQKFEIVFTEGKKKITYNYELKPRDPQRMAIESFGPSDVL
ncbi:MAG TPA: alpha-amylase, partial [Porphyromonadaceae bacterium]|nr:alpha-amylase [Porphyromonadaceae bacterium]HCA98517.1 alpha-amylase [Porphyromonadaceae bacterium]HCB89040.1 alpha-amylase [Porphyromonadaceae bacterium]